ncbi:MAG: carboxypeptidase-like regulatory domain-containing protein [Muribaculaceae bacterium]|nr:carboxypeptidase-like regulatory domain-containing protein [Muribaculaceae bacterium]
MNSIASKSWYRLFSLLLGLIVAFNAVCADFLVGGQLTNDRAVAIEGAVVTFTNIEQPELIFKGKSDNEGLFKFDAIPGGEYSISITAEGYNPVMVECFIIASDMPGLRATLLPNEETKAKELEEVEVIAKALQTYGDRTEMYLSSYNRNFGVNALDAISSLPRFIPSVNSNTLTNNQMAEVNILINGRRASADELRNLNGNDIAKVVYYQDAPAKYSGLYGGAVANVILKKPKKVSLKAQVDAGAALTSAANKDGLGFTMLSPSSMLNVGYSFTYNNNTGIKEYTTYDYGDLLNYFDTRSMRKEGKSNSANISYQWEKGTNMFFAKFIYSTSDRHERYDEDLYETTVSNTINGTRNTRAHRYNDIFNLNLYYSHQFDKGIELMADVVGTINNNASITDITQLAGEGSAYDDYNIDNSIHANVKTLIANVSLTAPLWGGSATVSLYNHYLHLDQRYISNYFPDLPSQNISSQNSASISMGYNRQFGKLGMSVNLSVFHNRFTTTADKVENYAIAYPRVNLSYAASSWLTLNTLLSSEGSISALGTQNINRYFIDTRYFRENITYRKPNQGYVASLSADIIFPSGKFMLFPYITYKYTHNSYYDYVYREGNDFISRPTLLPNMNLLNYILYAIWMPVDGLQIRPYFIGDFMAYSTPDGHQRFNAVSGRLMANYSYRNFTFSATLLTPYKRLNGITRSYHGWNASASVYYQISGFYAGLDFNYDGDTSWSLIEVPGFSSRVDKYDKNMRHNISISLGYNFKIGKYNRSPQHKKLMNQETESGL